ncbi:rhodanese-like domain-containing protein [Methyloterricola oryzae]|uniref:rhodanese-like domain-containing protein n=1 Tax=Methyloterricola oryzae TaxID=1495050 RepID=UPI000AEBD14C
MSLIKTAKPPQAFEDLQANPSAVLLDVRDRIEYAFVGHPVEAVNIPWKDAPDWKPNPNFVDEVRQRVHALDTPLYLMCRSGQRSMDAAKALAAAGFTNLTNVDEGFEGPLDEKKHRGGLGGWRFHGLPWEQS